jgi:hypothetical protein
MKPQITEKIITDASITEIGTVVLNNFKRISKAAVPKGKVLQITGIGGLPDSICKINVEVHIKPVPNGYMLIAEVKQETTVFFWCVFAFGILTIVFFIIPVGIFLLYGYAAKKTIENCFRNINHEIGMTPMPVLVQKKPSTDGLVSDLEKLSNLFREGVLSQDEFEEQKRRLLSRD